MNKRIDRAMRGPSWTEVILGALISVILGVILGAILLMLRPVVVAKDAPKDADPKAVYFIEGPHESGKASQAQAKRRAFIEGQSVTVTDNELNALIAPAGGSPAAPPAPKPAEKKKADGKAGDKAAPAASGEMFAVGASNVRIQGGIMQVGVPLNLNVLGISQKVIAQARGGFVKKGDMFVYEPDVIYVGSCPVQRLPFVSGYIRHKFATAEPLPDDIKASWMKLTNVAIEGNALKLTMP